MSVDFGSCVVDIFLLDVLLIMFSVSSKRFWTSLLFFVCCYICYFFFASLIRSYYVHWTTSVSLLSPQIYQVICQVFVLIFSVGLTQIFHNFQWFSFQSLTLLRGCGQYFNDAILEAFPICTTELFLQLYSSS